MAELPFKGCGRCLPALIGSARSKNGVAQLKQLFRVVGNVFLEVVWQSMMDGIELMEEIFVPAAVMSVAKVSNLEEGVIVHRVWEYLT